MTPGELDLPDHSIRESRRAVHVHLRFSLRGGLEVVVPPGFDRSEIPGLLHEKRRWIERTRRELDAQRLLLDPWPHDRIPERIELRAIGEIWTVETLPRDAGRVSARELDGRRVLISGPLGDAERWRAALKRWLARKAGQHLAAWAEREAGARRLRHGSVSIRWQRSRWGSCSRRGGRRTGASRLPTGPTLSLNAGLLFLPPHLVRYVILHELCHTARMDHSPAFWTELERIEPQARVLREELRSAWRYVPSWLEPPIAAQPPATLPAQAARRSAPDGAARGR